MSVPIDFHYMDKKYNRSQRESKLFGYQYSSKYIYFFVFHKSKKCIQFWNTMRVNKSWLNEKCLYENYSIQETNIGQNNTFYLDWTILMDIFEYWMKYFTHLVCHFGLIWMHNYDP